MLAQKKPLESIQRSQAINFVAEIFYDELQFILDRRLLDHTMVNCHGMNSRVKSRDVLSVSEQHVATTNAGKEYILLNLARNSIYHQLPELLFHPLVLSTPGMSNKEIVEAIRANEKQDKELIQFFAPFDTEFFKEKVRINNRHLNFFSDPDSKKNFIKMIEVMENVELSITPHQKYKMLNSPFKPVDGKIIYKKTEEDAKMKEIQFKNAYIVHYSETLDANNDVPMTITITFSAEEITVGSAALDNRWPKK